MGFPVQLGLLLQSAHNLIRGSAGSIYNSLLTGEGNLSQRSSSTRTVGGRVVLSEDMCGSGVSAGSTSLPCVNDGQWLFRAGSLASTS